MSKVGDLFCMTIMLVFSVLWFEMMMSILFYQRLSYSYFYNSTKRKSAFEKNYTSSQESSTKSLTYYIPFDAPENNPFYQRFEDSLYYMDTDDDSSFKPYEAANPIPQSFSKITSLRPIISSSPVPFTDGQGTQSRSAASPFTQPQKRHESVSKGGGKPAALAAKARPTPLQLQQPDKNSKKHRSSSY